MNSSDGGKTSVSITRTYYALETFCESLGNLSDINRINTLTVNQKRSFVAQKMGPFRWVPLIRANTVPTTRIGPSVGMNRLLMGLCLNSSRRG